jgi:hypothetical protein
LNFPSVPFMKRLDIYHTSENVVGLQVIYRGDPFLGKLEFSAKKNTATYIENCKKDSIYFLSDEYITNIKTSVRESVERLEFKTNQGRSFYFGSRTAVDHIARLNIADKG